MWIVRQQRRIHEGFQGWVCNFEFGGDAGPDFRPRPGVDAESGWKFPRPSKKFSDVFASLGLITLAVTTCRRGAWLQGLQPNLSQHWRAFDAYRSNCALNRGGSAEALWWNRACCSL